MMIIQDPINSARPQSYQGSVSARCPACRQNGTFEGVANNSDLILRKLDYSKSNPENDFQWIYLIQRFCPNIKCRAHIFVVIRAEDESIAASYPAIRLDFDSSSIPSKICSTFEEALTCVANNCFTAAAIMVRKTLEELCEERGAKGNNLSARIKDLAKQVTLPNELLEGVDHLRMLGNDAAHIESKNFDNVGQLELETAIELTKEVLKAIYQYAGLLEKLKALRKSES